MAETISRSLRDGALDGEYAPALNLVDSLRAPLGSHAFNYFLVALVSNIAAAKSQARGVVLVAFTRSPSFYLALLRRRGVEASKLDKWVKILDCYSDPLGWKDRIRKTMKVDESSVKGSGTVFKDVRDADKLLSSIIDLGRGFLGQGKERFAVAIDSVSDMLRYTSLPAVASLINTLRSHDQISCIFWLLQANLHEPRAASVFEYISTMIASLEPIVIFTDIQRTSENLFWLEQNSYRGKFNVRLKRRNGRVKITNEEFHVEQTGIKFSTGSSENIDVNHNLLPKVQFNLQLSEKERADRANVILPFEHQGNGESIQIYDGRRSLSEDQKYTHLTQPSALLEETNAETDGCGKGEIHYIRDSDDEHPDSDEDPDDDLEI